MENVKESILLKFLCYILIPIMIFVLAISIIDVSITSQYGEMGGPEEYIETEEFGQEYLLTLVYNVRNITKGKTEEQANPNISEEELHYDYYNEIEDDSYEYPVYYQVINYNSTSISNYINYIIIDEENGNMFTNIRSSNYIEEINKLKNEKKNWTYEDENISTNINTINKESAKYIISPYYSIDNLQGYKIYSNIDPSSLSYSNSLYVQQAVYNIFKEHQNLPTYLIPISAISLIVMIVYLIWATGHEKGKEGIVLNSLDKISYEIITTVIIFIIGMMMSFAIASIETQIPQKILMSVFLLCYLIGYACLAVLVSTTIRRLKAKQFIRSFLIYKICVWMKRTIKKIECMVKTSC